MTTKGTKNAKKEILIKAAAFGKLVPSLRA